MKLRSFIKRFKRVINLVSVLSNTSDYFLWIQAYLKLFIHSVLLGKIYVLLTYLVFNVQIMVSLSGLEPPTSRLSGVRSNQLSYRPINLNEQAFKTEYNMSRYSASSEEDVPNISLERRWSSRTFRYGYLVTTSPQSFVPPSTASS